MRVCYETTKKGTRRLEVRAFRFRRVPLGTPSPCCALPTLPAFQNLFFVRELLFTPYGLEENRKPSRRAQPDGQPAEAVRRCCQRVSASRCVCSVRIVSAMLVMMFSIASTLLPVSTSCHPMLSSASRGKTSPSRARINNIHQRFGDGNAKTAFSTLPPQLSSALIVQSLRSTHAMPQRRTFSPAEIATKRMRFHASRTSYPIYANLLGKSLRATDAKNERRKTA